MDLKSKHSQWSVINDTITIPHYATQSIPEYGVAAPIVSRIYCLFPPNITSEKYNRVSCLVATAKAHTKSKKWILHSNLKEKSPHIKVTPHNEQKGKGRGRQAVDATFVELPLLLWNPNILYRMTLVVTSFVCCVHWVKSLSHLAQNKATETTLARI